MRIIKTRSSFTRNRFFTDENTVADYENTIERPVSRTACARSFGDRSEYETSGANPLNLDGNRRADEMTENPMRMFTVLVRPRDSRHGNERCVIRDTFASLEARGQRA